MCLLVFVVLNLFLLSFFLDFVILLQLKALRPSLEVETGQGEEEGGASCLCPTYQRRSEEGGASPWAPPI